MKTTEPPPPVRRRLQRGAYLLPSIFTVGNIMLGFAAVVRGMEGDFERAAVLIFIAGILDGLDGRIARMSGTESDFGREFDSLADVLTFGAAPALLSIHWGLLELGRIGWLVPLFFLLCTTIRLARFNVQTTSHDSRYFVGLPSPAAAGSIASVLFLASQWGPETPSLEWQIALLLSLVVVGSLMVSTFRYPSPKQIDLRRRLSYRAALLVATGILVLAYEPAAFLLTSALLYTLAGPGGWLVGRLRRLRSGDSVSSDLGKVRSP